MAEPQYGSSDEALQVPVSFQETRWEVGSNISQRNTLGLHVLYPPRDSAISPVVEYVIPHLIVTSGDDRLKLGSIVAVHGLGGDSYSTWTVDKTLWLRDLLPTSDEFKNARVMTFGYDARAFIRPFERSRTSQRVFTFAEALVNDLADKRASAAARNRPIIFVGHSLGGIVIKNALRHAQSRSSMFGSIVDSTKAIVFFGTPHQGADAATWATYLGLIGKSIGLRSTQVTEELQRWSDPLVELTTMFSEIASNFQITTFFEKIATHGVMIVPEGSARMGQRNERIRGLEADHLSMCKLTDQDPNWRIVLARFEAIAQGDSVLALSHMLPDPIRIDPSPEKKNKSLEGRFGALRR